RPFLRSVVRQILQQLRVQDSARYAGELDRLFRSASVRFHIKQLALDSAATQPQPQPSEINVLRNVFDTQSPLIPFFMDSSPAVGWEHALHSLWQRLARGEEGDALQWQTVRMAATWITEAAEPAIKLLDIVLS